jgi:prolyl-tRNA synthetase
MVAEAQSGAMGGSHSQEFLVASEAGEDYVVVCRQSGYCANLEKAVSRPAPPAAADPEGSLEPEEFHTPGRKTIAEVAEFTGLPETAQMKSLVMVADGKPYLLLVRGDHQLSEAKFASATGAREVRPAEPAEISDWFGAAPGSLGPVGISRMPVLADLALRGRKNMIAGANRDDYHLRNVTPDEDFHPQWHDLRQVTAGDTEIHTGELLEIVKAIEIGHIFKLGYKYSDPMKLRVLNEQGVEVTPIMGSYGIGMERILCAAVELYHDENGMAMPAAIAPFTVVITPVNYKGEQKAAVEELYARFKSSGLDVVLDDRDERPGVKFKDAELIGIPFRLTVGKKLGQGVVEIMDRRSRLTYDVPVPETIDWIKHRISQA